MNRRDYHAAPPARRERSRAVWDPSWCAEPPATHAPAREWKARGWCEVPHSAFELTHGPLRFVPWRRSAEPYTVAGVTRTTVTRWAPAWALALERELAKEYGATSRAGLWRRVAADPGLRLTLRGAHALGGGLDLCCDLIGGRL